MFSEQSVVAVRKWPKDAHAVASKLGGHFTSMEEMESKDLLAHAGRLYRCQGCSRALAVIEFAALCVTQVRRHLRTAEMRLLKGELPIAMVGSGNERAVEAIVRIVTEGDPIVVADALGAIQKLPEARTYRAELLSEMRRTMRLAATMPGVAWDEVAWEVRDRARREGRRVERRIVSRTLLVKGLEFDHAIVLDADELDAKNLYVAMTRGSILLPDRQADHGSGADAEAVASPCSRLRHGG